MLSPPILILIIAVCGILIFAPHLLYYNYIRKNLRRSAYATKRLKNAVKLSVLICTLNAAKNIHNKVEQVLRQNYPRSSLELIVVDGGSTDGTVETLRSIRDKLSSEIDFTLVENRPFVGKASQINEGFKVAKGEFVITTDVDVKIDETAIGTLVDSLAEDNVGAVCARQVLTNPHQSTATRTEAKYRGYYELLRIGESNLCSTPIFHGGLSAYRRSAVSPIDEDVNADDTQLALSAIHNGYRAVYESNCVFYNESPKGFRNAWSQRVRRAQGLERVFWRNRDMLFNRKYGSFGSIVFPAECFMHLISPLLFAGEIALLVLLLFSSAPFSPMMSAVGVMTIAVLAVFLYFVRSLSAAELLITYVLYQLALVWAMVLHAFGRNYARWSWLGKAG
jgi:cellulose synthase/poly-beta-1,6-N-acetylglucosamine synthase-like glycosyltransferase